MPLLPFILPEFLLSQAELKYPLLYKITLKHPSVKRYFLSLNSHSALCEPLLWQWSLLLSIIFIWVAVLYFSAHSLPTVPLDCEFSHIKLDSVILVSSTVLSSVPGTQSQLWICWIDVKFPIFSLRLYTCVLPPLSSFIPSLLQHLSLLPSALFPSLVLFGFGFTLELMS